MAKELNARMLDVALSMLRERGEPTPRLAVRDAVEKEVANRTDAGADGPRPRWHQAFGWMLSQSVAVGWIHRPADATFELTTAGTVALDTFDEIERDRELGRLYRRSRKAVAGDHADDRGALLTDAVSLIGAGEWTTYGDLAEVTGLTAQQVGGRVGSHKVEHGWRILQADGTISPGFRWSPPGRPESPREVLEAEGLTFDSAGHADPAQRVTADDLRDVLELPPGRPTTRAWLVRGASVDGHDLVITWLQKGSVSLAASMLRALDPPITRSTLTEYVEHDYAHKAYVAREAKVDEFDAFLNRMSAGDLVMTTTQGTVYVGRVTGEAESVVSSDNRSNLRREVSWLNATAPLSYIKLPAPLPAQFQSQSDIVDLSEHLTVIEKLAAEFEHRGPLVPEPAAELAFPQISSDLADSLLVDTGWLQEQADLLWDRRQMIFYGPPGTGKTFIARRLAHFLTEPNAVRLVQFHPSYTYEDFFEGFRPVGGADGSLRFERRPGPFRLLVESAREKPSQPHVLIIDEINRANLAKVFGELYFLLEYRQERINLLYSPEEAFTLPENVFVIGTMNTADRSIALVDSAMRRRFGFTELHPDVPPTRDLLPRWLEELHTKEPIEYALDAPKLLKALNREIEYDLRLGPSYFMRSEIYRKPDGLARVWRSAVLPLLQEYFVDDPDTVGRLGLDTLRATIGGGNAEDS